MRNGLRFVTGDRVLGVKTGRWTERRVQWLVSGLADRIGQPVTAQVQVAGKWWDLCRMAPDPTIVNAISWEPAPVSALEVGRQ